MGSLFKTKGISDFRYIECRLPEQNFGFLDNPTTDDICGGFAGKVFNDFIEVVDMNC